MLLTDFIVFEHCSAVKDFLASVVDVVGDKVACFVIFQVCAVGCSQLCNHVKVL